MSETELIYRVPSARDAVLATRELDGFERDCLVGLGVIVRGYVEQAEEFYVFANLGNPSEDDIRIVTGILRTRGSKADLTLDQLLASNPRPHLVANGAGNQILAALRKMYPGCD